MSRLTATRAFQMGITNLSYFFCFGLMPSEDHGSAPRWRKNHGEEYGVGSGGGMCIDLGKFIRLSLWDKLWLIVGSV